MEQQVLLEIKNLTKVFPGVVAVDHVSFDIRSFKPENVLDAQSHGINMVHQELSMMPNRTVAQNIFVGREPVKGKGLKWIDTKKMNEESQKLLDGLGVGESIKAEAWVKDLSIALQQMVEVAKATSTENKLLILDEPTSSLTAPEIKALFEIIQTLKDRGLGIIYISHRMNEIFEVGDRITVMRDGKYVGTREVWMRSPI